MVYADGVINGWCQGNVTSARSRLVSSPLALTRWPTMVCPWLLISTWFVSPGRPRGGFERFGNPSVCHLVEQEV